jgi:hypothetical protein
MELLTFYLPKRVASSQPARQPGRQPSSHSASQSASQLASLPNNQPAKQLASQPASRGEHDQQQEVNTATSTRTPRCPAAPFHLFNNGQVARSMCLLHAYIYIYLYIWLIAVEQTLIVMFDLCAQMPPRDHRGPPAILPSRPCPRYLGFVMLTLRAWFSSFRSCEPELGIWKAVRVGDEKPREVGKYLWHVRADKYLSTSICRQVFVGKYLYSRK